MKKEYRKLLIEDISRLMELKEDVEQELFEVVAPCMDFPSKSYDLTQREITKINDLRNKIVAICDLISFLDCEVRKCDNEEVI